MRRMVQGLGFAALAATGVALARSSDTATGPTAVKYNASLSASNERNADGTQKSINSTATGTAALSLIGDTLTYAITVNGLSGPAVAAHIHVGSSTQNGAVIVPFTITSGVAAGTLANGSVTITTLTTVSADSLRTLLNNGNAYVNVHTAANPAGEMRGQVAKQ